MVTRTIISSKQFITSVTFFKYNLRLKIYIHIIHHTILLIRIVDSGLLFDLNHSGDLWLLAVECKRVNDDDSHVDFSIDTLM